MYVTKEMQIWLNSQSTQELRDALRGDVGDLAQVIRNELFQRRA